MHEASIVDNLLELVTRRTPAGARVASVHVRVGGFSGVSPESLEFYFEALRADRIGDQATLVIEREPLRARCGECLRSWTFEEPQWVCPGCGAPKLDYENGMALELVAIEVDDAGNDSDRAEDPRAERGVCCTQPAPPG